MINLEKPYDRRNNMGSTGLGDQREELKKRLVNLWEIGIFSHQHQATI